MNIISDHADRLTRLTDDLLKLSQIEAGKLELQRRPVPIASIMKPCLETIRLMAEEKKLTIEDNCDSDMPLVNGDALALQQVLRTSWITPYVILPRADRY